MTWPFENDTSTIIKKLAKADLKEHKLKTLITAIIIVIATCLMATVFSILVNDALKQSTQAPYHAMFRAVSEDTKNKLDRKSTRLNSSHGIGSRMPSSA